MGQIRRGKHEDGNFRLLSGWAKVSANPLPKKQLKMRKWSQSFRGSRNWPKADNRLRSYSKELLNLERNSGNLWKFSLGLLPSSSSPQLHSVVVLPGYGREAGFIWSRVQKSMPKKYWRKFFKLKGNNNRLYLKPTQRNKRISKGNY